MKITDTDPNLQGNNAVRVDRLGQYSTYATTSLWMVPFLSHKGGEVAPPPLKPARIMGTEGSLWEVAYHRAQNL